MPFQDNTIDISDLQKADITVGDLKALVTLLECTTAHLLLPDEATMALEKLRKAAQGN
jgi:hypothetical protein